MTLAGGILRAVAMMGACALIACTQPPAITTSPAPMPRPEQVVIVPQPVVVPKADVDPRLATYYKRLENDLLVRGLLRTDGGGPDTPFTDTMLARNFVRIALFDEYISDGDLLRAQATASNLRRWDRPVRMAVEFGATIPAAQRAKDTAIVNRYAARLARATRHPITVSNSNPNFHVMFLNEADRHGAEARLRQLVPGIANSSLRAIINLPRDQLCIVVAFSEGGRSDYTKAIAVIRGEHPDLLRRSCVHEELAQGLGLANDSPAARPSIFNDDEEFGLLTTHDELLLRMLYDTRLRSGMAPAIAAPIARLIATELTGGGAS